MGFTRNLSGEWRLIPGSGSVPFARRKEQAMPVREGPPQPTPPPKTELPPIQEPAPFPTDNPYPAEKARGGEIVLRTPVRRVVFIAGLAGALLLALLVGLFA
jgi:hypothetical protein